MNAKITIGYELPKEAWLNAAENIEKIAPAVASVLLGANHEGQGTQQAEEFMADMQLAHTALNYVAEFARDKCRIIPVPDRSDNT